MAEPTEIHTPTLQYNVASSYDWQQRAHDAETGLQIEKTKLEQARRVSRRLQNQMADNARAISSHNHNEMRAKQEINILNGHNYALRMEVQRLKCIVRTLENVLQMLHSPSSTENDLQMVVPTYKDKETVNR